MPNMTRFKKPWVAWVIFAVLAAASPVVAAVVLQSGATLDQLTIDAASKAARVTQYTTGGVSVTYPTVDPVSGAVRATNYDFRGLFDGQRSTYGAATIARIATTAGTGPFFSICGSATRTVRVHYLGISGTVATTAVRAEVVLKLTSTPTTGGTAVPLLANTYDGNNPSPTIGATYYSVLATAGSSVGAIGAQFNVWPITATVAATDAVKNLTWRFGAERGDEPVVLRGTARCLEANFGTTTTNAPTLIVAVRWTEE